MSKAKKITHIWRLSRAAACVFRFLFFFFFLFYFHFWSSLVYKRLWVNTRKLSVHRTHHWYYILPIAQPNVSITGLSHITSGSRFGRLLFAACVCPFIWMYSISFFLPFSGQTSSRLLLLLWCHAKAHSYYPMYVYSTCYKPSREISPDANHLVIIRLLEEEEEISRQK